MRKVTMMMLAFMTLGATGVYAQTSSGTDNCEYVDHKNNGGTGYHTLEIGQQEMAAQTYHYSGPGRIERVYISGDNPSGFTKRLRVGVYNVDGNGRPTTLIDEDFINWPGNYSGARYAGFSNLNVNQNFALVVDLEGVWIGWPLYTVITEQGTQFNLEYTGDGEGQGEDLAARAGTSTGGNWVSIIGQDGDYYIYPRMRHYNTANFTVDDYCIDAGGSVDFTDLSEFTKDEMFNTISHPDYAGSDVHYEWDFDDGSPVSNLASPTHTFTNPGVYEVSLTTTIGRWPIAGTSTITNTKTMRISVGLSVSGNGTDLTCFGSGDGEIDLTATGGDNSNYTYMITHNSWQSGTNFNGLNAGTYEIYVQDALGCEAQGTNVVLGEPSQINISSIGVTEATCGNSDGALLVAATGGSGTLTYSNDGGSNFQASGSFTALNSGAYEIVVEDANGCQTSEWVNVDNNAGPTLTVQSHTNISCFGGNDGTITMIGSGGTGALEYSVDGTNWQASGTFTGLTAGQYIPQVRDAAGCLTSMCDATIQMCGIELTQPTAITFSLETTDALCNGSSDGEILVTNGIGGIGTFTYSSDGTNFQSSPSFSGFAAGTHMITVKDAAGCTATGNAVINEPTAVTANVTSTTDLTCNGSGDGELSIDAAGGVGEYSFSLNGTDFYPEGEFGGLDAGTYNIVVEDANGCEAMTVATLNEPTEITLSTFNTTAATCGSANGGILAQATGGAGTFSYSIDGLGGSTTNGSGSFGSLASGEYEVIVEDMNGCVASFSTVVIATGGAAITGTTQTNVTCPGGDNGTVSVTATSPNGGLEYAAGGSGYQASSTVGGLSAGDNIVTVRDALGCIDSTIVTITEPSPFTINLTPTDVSCYDGDDGEISVSAAGGSGTLAYSIDGMNFQSSTDFTGLMAGDYTVTVKDAGQCEGEAMVTIDEPTEIHITSSYLNVDCYGDQTGSITATAVGGTGAMTYSIDGTGFQASGTFTNLSAGNYIVIAKDANNCTVTQMVVVSEPDQLVLTANVSDVSCAGGHDGVVDLTVTGGTTPMAFVWSNGVTTEDIFNLGPDNYSVIVTDANGCTETGNWDITEPSNAITINGTVTDATGATNNDGAVDITVTGGTPSYSYSWNNGDMTEDIFALLPGVYVVTVTDANGCSMQGSFTVNFTLGLEDESNEISLDLYPNPTRDILNIKFGSNQNVENLSLIDITGKVVYENIPSNNNDSEYELNLNFLPEGVYFLNVYTNDQVLTRKVVISK